MVKNAMIAFALVKEVNVLLPTLARPLTSHAEFWSEWIRRGRLPILKAVKWANIGGKDYLIESFVDISEQKRAEAALSESEEKFRATFESCKEAIVIVDDAWNLCYTNQAAQKVFGCTKEETGKFFLEKCLKDAPTEFLQSVNEASKDCKGFTEALMGKTLETTLLKASGEEIHVEVSLSTFMQKGRCHIVGFIRDITERKEQEKALLESQQKFMALFSENPEAVAFCDKDSHVLDINPGFTRLFGYSSQEAKGKDLFNLVPPPAEIGDSGFVTHKLQRGHIECSTTIKKKDGSEAYVSLSGAPVIVNGSIIGHVTVYRDITDLVHANEELSRLFEAQSLMLNKASLLTEKLSVTGSLTRHDVRNKLSAITGYTYLAKKRLVGNDEVRSFLIHIEEVNKNIIRILDFAKTYEMLGNQELASVNVGKTVWDAASLFADLKGVTVINECEGFEVQADSLLMELFHNMIDNSLKYGEKITQIRVYTQKNPDGSTNLIYEDDGVGIEPAVKAKLFQKGFGKGTGYGLYLIKRICEMYEWTIIENGELGKGVKFTLKLPTTV